MYFRVYDTGSNGHLKGSYKTIDISCDNNLKLLTQGNMEDAKYSKLLGAVRMNDLVSIFRLNKNDNWNYSQSFIND